MDQNSQADRLAAVFTKIQGIFVTLAEPILVLTDALMPIFEVLGLMVSKMMEFKNLIIGAAIGFGAIKIINLATSGALQKNLGLMWKQVAALAAQAVAFAVANPITTLIGLGVAGATYAYLSSKTQKVGDVDSAADGKTQISTKEGGLFELSKNDDLVAAPGASRALANASNNTNNGGTTVIQAENKETKQTNKLLEQLLQHQTKQPQLSAVGLYEVQ